MKTTDNETPEHRQVGGVSRDGGASPRPELDRVLASDPPRDSSIPKPVAGKASRKPAAKE